MQTTGACTNQNLFQRKRKQTILWKFKVKTLPNLNQETMSIYHKQEVKYFSDNCSSRIKYILIKLNTGYQDIVTELKRKNVYSNAYCVSTWKGNRVKQKDQKKWRTDRVNNT